MASLPEIWKEWSKIKMANELDINEVLKTIPPEMVEDMKKQAEKYGFPFEEYVQSVLGAIVMDPDLGAY